MCAGLVPPEALLLTWSVSGARLVSVSCEDSSHTGSEFYPHDLI